MGEELLFDLEDRKVFGEDIFYEVLNEELRQDMEVLLIVLEECNYLGTDPVAAPQLELVLIHQSHDLEHLWSEHFVPTYLAVILELWVARTVFEYPDGFLELRCLLLGYAALETQLLSISIKLLHYQLNLLFLNLTQLIGILHN